MLLPTKSPLPNHRQVNKSHFGLPQPNPTIFAAIDLMEFPLPNLLTPISHQCQSIKIQVWQTLIPIFHHPHKVDLCYLTSSPPSASMQCSQSKKPQSSRKIAGGIPISKQPIGSRGTNIKFSRFYRSRNESSGVLVDCSELRSQLNRLKDHVSLEDQQTLNIGFNPTLCQKSGQDGVPNHKNDTHSGNPNLGYSGEEKRKLNLNSIRNQGKTKDWYTCSSKPPKINEIGVLA